AVGDEETSSRIHCETMRRIELTGPCSLLTPRLDELAVLIELHNSRVGISAVSVSNEDIAVRSGDHIRRLVECILAVTGDAGFSEREEDLALRTELDHDVALTRGFWIVSASRWDAICHPDISFFVYVYAVREDKHAAAKAFDQRSCFVKLEDYWQRGTGARICSASFSDPNRFAV